MPIRLVLPTYTFSSPYPPPAATYLLPRHRRCFIRYSLILTTNFHDRSCDMGIQENFLEERRLEVPITLLFCPYLANDRVFSPNQPQFGFLDTRLCAYLDVSESGSCACIGSLVSLLYQQDVCPPYGLRDTSVGRRLGLSCLRFALDHLAELTDKIEDALPKTSIRHSQISCRRSPVQGDIL